MTELSVGPSKGQCHNITDTMLCKTLVVLLELQQFSIFVLYEAIKCLSLIHMLCKW